MATDKAQKWYVVKRAEAFVYSLFAERPIVVRPQEPDSGIDFLLELRKDQGDLGRSLAVEVLAYLDFPGEAALGKQIASRFPARLREEFLLPLIVFAIQVKELAAVYCWVLEPAVEGGRAALRPHFEYEWKKLDDRAMDQILACVDEYWEALLHQVRR
jgi:hypothetical protein